MFLDNLYAVWSSAEPAEKDAVLEKGLVFALDVQDSDHDQSFEAIAPMLLPVVRHRHHMSTEWLNPDCKDSEQIFKPLCEGLVAAIAIDRPGSISIVNKGQLERWSRTFDDVMTLALTNLRERSPSCFERNDEGVYISSYGDYYDASRLLLPHLFEALPLKGDPVAIPISRRVVIVAGLDDAAALDAMASLAGEAFAEEMRPISCQPIVLRDGHWQPLDSTDKHPESLDRLRVQQRLGEHAQQKKHLDKLFEQTGRDIFVATLGGAQGEGRCYTWAVWMNGVATLLPQADAIVLRSEDDTRMMTRYWTDIVTVLGPLPTEPATFPSRYLVEQLSDENWYRLETEFTAPTWLNLSPS